MNWLPYEIREKVEWYMNSLKWNFDEFSLDWFNNAFMFYFMDQSKEVFDKRINYKHQKENLEVIAEECRKPLTRVYNTEKLLYKRIDIVYTALWKSEIWKKYIQDYLEVFYMDDNYWLVDFSWYDNWWIYWNYMWYVNKIIFSSIYDIYELNNEIWWEFFYFNKDVINKDILLKYFKNIDEIYKSDREEEKVFSKDLFISKVIKWNEEAYFDSEWYFFFIKQYLSTIYSIFLLRDSFTFPKNKDTLRYKIIKEFNKYDTPVHYDEIVKNLRREYPSIEVDGWQVINVISRIWKSLWNWMYASFDYKMSWWNIVDIVYDFLSKAWCSKTEKEIVEYVQKNKFVNDSSVLAVFTQDNRFVKIPWWRVGLSEWWTPEEIKSIEIKNNIIKILNDNYKRNFLISELYAETKGIMGDLSLNDFVNCLNNLKNSGEIWVSHKDNSDFYYAL